MFFSYLTSILLLSFALYGLWHVILDLWDFYRTWRLATPIRASLLIVVQNNEQQIEGMFRYLLRELSSSHLWYEIVIVDFASEDMTPIILDRLVQDYPQVKALYLSALTRPVPEGIAVCQGEVIYVVDLVSRISFDSFTTAIDAIRRL